MPAKPVADPSDFQGSEVTLTRSPPAASTEQVEAPVAGVLDAWFVDVGAEVYEDQLMGRIRNTITWTPPCRARSPRSIARMCRSRSLTRRR